MRSKVVDEIRSILHLPLWGRLFHHKARRPLAVVGTGCTIMLFGSLIASNAHAIEHVIPVHHLVFDALGYFLHGVGAIPALRYIEPVWMIFLGAAAE